jgi:hypothetical protein
MSTANSPLVTRSAARLLLAGAAVGAGAIHLAFGPEHLQEYLPLGIGFLAAGVLQILWGLYLAIRESRRVLLGGALFSIAFVGVYLMSRTVGLPLGPDAFHPEGFAAADLLCCALELVVIVGALLLVRRPGALRAPLGLRVAGVFAGSLLLVSGATTYAVAAPAAEHAHEHATGHDSHPACPAAPVLTGVQDARGVDTGVTAYFSCKLLHEHDGHTGAHS